MTEQRHLVLVGGGHAHIEVLRRWAGSPLPGWRLTLLTREAMSPYSGMLPGVIAGLYRPEQAMADVRRLGALAQAEVVIDRATGIDPDARRVSREEGAALGYDLLSLDTGATPDTSEVSGAAEFALPLKPIDRLLPRIDALVEHAAIGQRIVVVGGGAAGFEVAIAIAVRLRARGVEVVLVAGEAGLLPGFPAALRQRATRALAERGIILHAGEDVAEVFEDGVGFREAPALPAEAVLWATGAAAAPWLSATGLVRDHAGFLRVDAFLRAVGRRDVFAAGDVASLDGASLPKAGVYAVRQGPVLWANLRAAATGGTMVPYRPQRDFLVLMSLGNGRALGTRNGLSFGGRWVWWLKDRIDRGFMARYQPANDQAAHDLKAGA